MINLLKTSSAGNDLVSNVYGPSFNIDTMEALYILFRPILGYA